MTKELKAAVAQRRIAKFKPGWEDLDLTEFSSITEDAASLVSQVEDSVNLSNLETISDTVAEILGGHKGALQLSGLTAISAAVAASLAQHDGWLHLDVSELSEDAALAFSKGIVTLNLTGLKNLDFTPGHVALARKLVADGTAKRLYNVKKFSKELLAEVPELKQQK